MCEENNRIYLDHTTNTAFAKELNIYPDMDKMQAYRRNCLQRINRMPRNRLPRVIKNCIPKGRPLERLLEM
jgi:hypothetical protein